ncbi:MAG TPA: site-2 protease family protein [Candidatus Ornithomonoglobus merdipullorum]|uniref:Site-2 protease family protein n=1 Tax=Candidatus Ornithomonoglobus merdipullorum TaxID=2840895 RepID=A0A9D1M9Q4_9FIRM|nr:site-2 protease family protein [Candidatus Ornithomonoglobus merdipullorum]
MSYIVQRLIMIPIVLIALTFHEFCHGLVSSKLGDPTPRLTGRLTLNPLAHLDPIGTLLMIFTGFGWAKPVQINPGYYKKPKWGMALTALAGPISNFVLAFAAMLVYTIIHIINLKTGVFAGAMYQISYFVLLFAQVNLCFMVFNLIPIPPLDGSRVLGLFLSTSAYFKLQRFERYSMILIIVLSFLNVFSVVIGTGVNFVLDGIINVCNLIVQAVI